MAKNLRAKIAESDTMVIHDVNTSALEKFKQEVGNVEIAQNVREVAEKTVGTSYMSLRVQTQDEPIFVLSMI